MCMDAEMGLWSFVTLMKRVYGRTGLLYMFGGWDGINDLSDLWQFTVETLRWDCLSTDTSQEVKQCMSVASLTVPHLGRPQWTLMSQDVPGLWLPAALPVGPVPQSFLALTTQSHQHPSQPNSNSFNT